MPKLERSSLAFENGLWNCQIDRKGQLMRIDIKGDDRFFDLTENVSSLNDFVENLDLLEAKSVHFATISEYREDVEQAASMSLMSVYVDDWEDARIWFSLGTSDRMLGVHWKAGAPVSVYCDAP